MEATNKRRKKIGWKLTKKGKQNVEFLIMTMVAIATVGYIMGGSWLLWLIMKSGVSM